MLRALGSALVSAGIMFAVVCAAAHVVGFKELKIHGPVAVAGFSACIYGLGSFTPRLSQWKDEQS